jgi:NAD(P)-dependent dehydrogenase (short-subunit alcohol dehydrogenase family)
MSSWVIVGASRGIGLEYVQQLSSDSSKTIFAIIRNRATASKLTELAAERKNIQIVLTDIGNPQKLLVAAEEVSWATGGGLDVLIFNAFLPGTENILLPVSAFAGKEEALERELVEPLKANAAHLITTVNTFLPLIRKGSASARKIIYITSGNGVPDVSRVAGIPNLLGYCVSKAAGNVIMAKYHAELSVEGIKTLSLSPGWVDTDSGRPPTQEAFNQLLAAFQKIEPNLKGMISTETSVRLQLKVIDDLDDTKSGMVLSQNGNTDWF